VISQYFVDLQGTKTQGNKVLNFCDSHKIIKNVIRHTVRTQLYSCVLTVCLITYFMIL